MTGEGSLEKGPSCALHESAPEVSMWVCIVKQGDLDKDPLKGRKMNQSTQPWNLRFKIHIHVEYSTIQVVF